jgi:gas vesicle protein
MTWELIEQYISILEKTNTQLSLWWNPYWVLITLLWVLFTIGAIVAAVLLYRQSQDYKQQQKAIQENQEKIFKEFLKKQETDVLNNNKKIEKIAKEFEELIAKYEKQFTHTTSKGKEDIEKTIEELRREKEKIMAQTYIPTVDTIETNNILNLDDYNILWSTTKELKICTKCSNKFYTRKKSSISISLLWEKVICPYCWYENYV